MQRMFRLIAVCLTLLAVGCGAVGPSAAPADFPTALRWDLVPRWIAWADNKPSISWPPDNGCATAPAARSLEPGQMIDRFGSESGNFFSPAGESFAARAVPYVCRQMEYRVYVVDKPLPVQTCQAAPWFGEPGGATQFQTARPAKDLLADGAIRMRSFAPASTSGPAPQCAEP